MKPDGAPGELVYLFCVAGKAPKGLDACGDIRCLPYKGICAVTGRASGDDFSGKGLEKNLGDLDWIERKARFHEMVVEKTMAASAVMPFKFGTVFESEDSLKRMLDQYLDEFRDILKKLEGKREWGVKVFYRCHNAENKNTPVAPKIGFEEEASPSSGVAFFERKKQERLTAELRERKINDARGQVYEALGGHSAEIRINRLLPPEANGIKEEMILNAAFLVDNEKAGAFIDEVEILKEEHPALEIECTGPWPPYNFCLFKEKGRGPDGK